MRCRWSLVSTTRTPQGPRNQGGAVRVVLTKDQRQRIADQTGVGLDTLVIEEGAAAWALRMPTMEKRIIENKALEMAGKSLVSEAKEKRIKKLINALEEIGDPTPEVRAMIEQLKDDPDGLEKLAKDLGKEMKGKASQGPQE
jgi:hypothetical protein